jgi:hypothetical protein
MTIKEWNGTFQITVDQSEVTGREQHDLHISINGTFSLKSLFHDISGLPLDVHGRIPPQAAAMIPRVTWTGPWTGSATVDSENYWSGKRTGYIKGGGSLSGNQVVLQIDGSGTLYLFTVSKPNERQTTCEFGNLLTPILPEVTKGPCYGLLGFGDFDKPLPSHPSLSGSGRPKDAPKKAQAEFHYSLAPVVVDCSLLSQQQCVPGSISAAEEGAARAHGYIKQDASASGRSEHGPLDLRPAPSPRELEVAQRRLQAPRLAFRRARSGARPAMHPTAAVDREHGVPRSPRFRSAGPAGACPGAARRKLTLRWAVPQLAVSCSQRAPGFPFLGGSRSLYEGRQPRL